MKNFLQKLISLFILFSLLVEFFLFFLDYRVKMVEASWPSFEVGSIPETLKAIWDRAKAVWDALDKKYRDLIVRIIIMKMQQDIIKSIEEESLYVSDWGSFLKETATNIAFNEFNEYVKKVSKGEINLCSPFSLQSLSFSLSASLGLLGEGGRNQYYGLPVSCTFEEFKANLKNTADFVQKGGWISIDILFSPSVNPYWISWQLEDAISTKALEEKEKRKSEAESSGGFLGKKTCYEGSGGTREEAVAVCTSKDSSGNVYYKTAGYSDLESCIRDVTGSCAKEGIITPGNMVSDAIMEAMGGDFQYSANVQSAIAAIINAIVAKMIRKGLASGSKGGDSYGIEEKDLEGTGFENFEKDRFKQDLEDAKKDYQDVITYLDQDLIPAIDQVLSLVKAKNLEDLNCLARNMQVEVDEGGSKRLYTVADLIDLVKDLSTVALQAKSESEENKSEVDSLLNQEKPSQTEIMNALNKLSSFKKKYQIITQDVDLINGGQEGRLIKMLSSIYDSLSKDEINCSS